MDMNDKDKFVSDAKAALDKKAFEKLGDMKASIAKDFIMPEVLQQEVETKEDEPK